MKDTLSNVLIFAVGAAIGSAVTWYFVKTKYEQIAQEEIDSVKAEFTKHVHTQGCDEKEIVEQTDICEEEPVEDTSRETYADIVKKAGYCNYSDVEPTRSMKADEDVPEEEPVARVIRPEELGETDYKIIELTYWADGVLTDTKNKIIQDADKLIGEKTLDSFGMYEPDALHVRNDEKKLDFEIMRDLKRYYDFFGDDPHTAEAE